MSFMVVFCSLWLLVVMEGDSVTLSDKFSQNGRVFNEIRWYFGSQMTCIAQHPSSLDTYASCQSDEFKGRVDVDNHTGALTISQTKTSDSGVYYYNFVIHKPVHRYITGLCDVVVQARLPVPVISSISSHSSSSSVCEVVCSAENVSDVTLSWYKGESLISSISVSDLSRVSLPLEIKSLDDSLICVLNDTDTRQNTHLHAGMLAQLCPEVTRSISLAEAWFRLVLSALVLVAAVTLVADDVTFRRILEKRQAQNQQDETHV